MMLCIFIQQKASLPSWCPVRRRRIRSHHRPISAPRRRSRRDRDRRSTSPASRSARSPRSRWKTATPSSGMEIEPKYMQLIHPDAQLLLRPKTQLNDMVVEVEPGSGKRHLESGDNFPSRADRTEHPTRRVPRHASTPTPASTCSCCSPAGRRASAAGAPALRHLPPLRALRPLRRRTEQARSPAAASRSPR